MYICVCVCACAYIHKFYYHVCVPILVYIIFLVLIFCKYNIYVFVAVCVFIFLCLMCFWVIHFMYMSFFNFVNFLCTPFILHWKLYFHELIQFVKNNNKTKTNCLCAGWNVHLKSRILRMDYSRLVIYLHYDANCFGHECVCVCVHSNA